MKVLLADDYHLVREGLKTTLKNLAADIEIAEAGNFNDIIAGLSVDPDINLLILDLRIPGMDGVAGLAQIRSRFPAVPVVILSASNSPRDVTAAFAQGVVGYIAKSLPVPQTVAALRQVLRGEIYRPGPVPDTADNLPGDPRFQELSPRERHVLSLLCEGCSNKEIARHLELQEVTVKAHLRQVFRKLGVSNRTQAVKLVLQAGWPG